MTLKQCNTFRKENLFLCVIKKEVNWEKADTIFLTIPGYPNQMTALDLLKMAVDEAIMENNENLTDEYKNRIEEEVKQQITPNIEEYYPVILAEADNVYYDLSIMKELDSEFKIIVKTPLSKYYPNADDFSFEEDEEGPYLNIDMKSFNHFVDDYVNGKIVNM